jgi:hypothetical protein
VLAVIHALGDWVSEATTTWEEKKKKKNDRRKTPSIFSPSSGN